MEKTHKEELCDSSSDQIKKLRWAEHVARMGDRITYRILVGRPEGRTLVGRSGGRWEDIKMIFKKWNWDAWTGLIWLSVWTGGGRL